MPKIQNFEVSAGDATDLNFDVDPDDVGVTLLGTIPYWCVYAQRFGVPYGDPLIKKVLDKGLQITNPDLLQYQVKLEWKDTNALLGNYYHEAFVIDENQKHISTTTGVMAVLFTGTRNFVVEEIPAA
jgi:hypothetical protein